MTGFEIATLAFQESTPAFQESTLAIRRIGLWIAAAHVMVGIGRIAVVAWGIRVMQRAAERRADDARDEARHRDKADERRHTETMRTLETLIARTAPIGR